MLYVRVSPYSREAFIHTASWSVQRTCIITDPIVALPNNLFTYSKYFNYFSLQVLIIHQWNGNSCVQSMTTIIANLADK